MVATPEQVAQALALLSQRFPNSKMGKEALAVYVKILIEEQLTPREIERAVQEAIRYETWFPPPQKLIEYARGATEAQIEDDWLKVMKMLSGDRGVSLQDLTEPGRDAVRSLGGIPWLREHYGPHTRREFRAAWAANASRRRIPALEKPED